VKLAEISSEEDCLIILGSHLYLLETVQRYWKCSAITPVKAIYTDCWKEAHDGFRRRDCPIVLRGITGIQEDLMALLNGAGAALQLRMSRAAQCEYLANSCTDCGALLGDRFLHLEPGDPFFPISEEHAADISMQRLNFEGDLAIDGIYAAGIQTEFIQRYAKRLDGVPSIE